MKRKRNNHTDYTPSFNYNDIVSNIRHELYTQLRHELYKQLREELYTQLRHELYAQIKGELNEDKKKRETVEYSYYS